MHKSQWLLQTGAAYWVELQACPLPTSLRLFNRGPCHRLLFAPSLSDISHTQVVSDLCISWGVCQHSTPLVIPGQRWGFHVCLSFLSENIAQISPFHKTCMQWMERVLVRSWDQLLRLNWDISTAALLIRSEHGEDGITPKLTQRIRGSIPVLQPHRQAPNAALKWDQKLSQSWRLMCSFAGEMEPGRGVI